MRRGTTAVNTFKTNVDMSTAELLYVTYKQNGEKILEKTLDDVTIDGQNVIVKLSQADTLNFMNNTMVQIQIRAKLNTDLDTLISTMNGEEVTTVSGSSIAEKDKAVIASSIVTARFGEILKDGEI